MYNPLKPTLSFLLGASHSGKSTFAKKWQTETSNRPRVVVTTDNIRMAIHGDIYNKDSETVVFAHKHIMLKTLLLENFHVLANGTHTRPESIKRILEIDINAIPIVINTPLDECIRRTSLTGQAHMIPVIKRHYRQLQEILGYGLERKLDEIRSEIEARWRKV
jgi:predicted kinase